MSLSLFLFKSESESPKVSFRKLGILNALLKNDRRRLQGHQQFNLFSGAVLD